MTTRPDPIAVLRTIFIMVVFAALFVVIVTLGSSLYHTHASVDNYIQINDFRAENLSTNATEQTLILQRTVDRPIRGDVLIELMLVEETTETQMQVTREQEFFETGNKTVVIVQPLPDDLEPGVYYYRMHVEFEIEGVTRALSERSNTFRIRNASEPNTASPASVNSTEVVS